MSEEFVLVLVGLWPVFLAFLLYAEFSAYCYGKRVPAYIQISAYSIWLVVMLAVLNATSPTSYAQLVHPLAYRLVTAWTVAVPLGAINFGARFLARRGRKTPAGFRGKSFS